MRINKKSVVTMYKFICNYLVELGTFSSKRKLASKNNKYDDIFVKSNIINVLNFKRILIR